jgi:hypothetical protein
MLIAAILFLIPSAAAQDTVTGGFQGDVTNTRTGAPIAGAQVTITSDRSGAVYNVTTDSKGVFFQGLLAPGTYQIRIVAPGFKEQLLRREIFISVTGGIVPVPVSMEPEPTPSAPPTVPAEADDIRAIINTTDARQFDSKKEDIIERIPLSAPTSSRTFDQLATLTPGVAPPPQTIGDVAGPGVGPGVGSAGQFAVNGLRSRGNNFTVDGSDNNDEDIGVRRQGYVALIPQPIESIEEFSIITLLPPARFGRNLGAQVNAVSKAGGNEPHGSLYGFFNSSRLNARNPFDTTNGNAVSNLRSANGQNVLLSGQPITVRNQSGGEDPFTGTQAGGTLGGAIRKDRLFYFLSAEFQKINSLTEKNFAVPTVEQRGPFGTGATGISTNFFTGQTISPLFPTESKAAAVFSLFPFANNPGGIYGANTFTQILDSSGRGVIASGRLDHTFGAAGRPQTFTARYNFTDDDKRIPAVGEAIFANVRSKVRTNNLSLFLNSGFKRGSAESNLLNQVRFSFGHTNLDFSEIRDRDFLIPSNELPGAQFLLNAPAYINVTLPQFGGQARYIRDLQSQETQCLGRPETTECVNGPVGQVIIAGFSPLGVDVYNFPQARTNKTFQVADDLTWRRGSHNMAFGADFRRTTLDSDLPRLARTLLTFNGSPRLVLRSGTCANGGIGDYCFLANSDPRAVIRPEDIAGLGAASNSLLTLNVDRPDSRVNLLYNQLNFFAQDVWRPKSDLSISFGLRYEYNTPVRESDRVIEDTFADTRLALVPVLRDVIGNRTTLFDPDRNNFAPRVGVAYSPAIFARQATVFRVGYGVYYDQILGAVANQSRNVFPTYLTVNLAASVFVGFGLDISNPATLVVNGAQLRRPGTLNQYNAAGLAARNTNFASVLSLFGGPNGLFANGINVTLPSRIMDTPLAHHYSFSFEQQLSPNYTVLAAYVGTSGRNLLRFTTPNLGSSLTVVPLSLGTFGSNVPSISGGLLIPQRPLDRAGTQGFETLGAINQFETTASSQYHALQTQLRARFRNRLNMQASYTFSKATDEVSDVFDLAGAFVLPQDSLNLAAERGRANFDVPHRFVYEFNYDFSGTAETGFLRKLTNGLQISTTGRLRSGQPFTVNSVVDVNLDGNLTDRLDNLNGLEITGDPAQPLRLAAANPTTLLARFGQNGSIGRNTFRSGRVYELDASIIKRFTFGRQSLAVRGDAFNFINRANYGIPVRLLEAAGFGRAVNVVTPARRLQLSIKYEF